MYKVNWYNRESGELIRQTELPYSQIMKLEEKDISSPKCRNTKSVAFTAGKAVSRWKDDTDERGTHL